MRSRFLMLVATLGLSACAAQSGDERDVGVRTESIVEGVESGPDQDAVVSLSVQTGAFGEVAVACSGTLVAPNLVLTSLQCLSAFDSSWPYSFRCTPEGYIDLDFPRSPINAGELGFMVDPEDVWVLVGQEPDRDEPDALGIRIYSYPTESVCRNDIAYVVLDRPLDPEPKSLRLHAGVSIGELTRVLGYSGDNPADRSRRERGSVAVRETGEGPYTERTGDAPVRTLVLGESACSRPDLGGPALSEETGAVLGVFSYSVGGYCTDGALNVFTRVAAYGELTIEAFEAAGHEPRLEPGAAGSAGDVTGSSFAGDAGKAGCSSVSPRGAMARHAGFGLVALVLVAGWRRRIVGRTRTNPRRHEGRA